LANNSLSSQSISCNFHSLNSNFNHSTTLSSEELNIFIIFFSGKVIYQFTPNLCGEVKTSAQG
jgi:hypothetical protein